MNEPNANNPVRVQFESAALKRLASSFSDESELVKELQELREVERRHREEVEFHTREQERARQEANMLEQLLGLWRSVVKVDSSDAATATETSQVSVVDAGRERVRSRENPRHLVQRIVEEHPERETWSPKQMREAMAAEGVESSLNAVRVLMLRMSRDELLHRIDPRTYSRPVPSANGTQELGEAEAVKLPTPPAVELPATTPGTPSD
jgi:hypothetical protein